MENNLNNLFQRTTGSLAKYLEEILPGLFEDWWQQAVLNKLSFQQKRKVEQLGFDSLSSMDLAALLRILDQNWYQVSTSLNLPPEARHFVKEMQTVRNRWAHAGADGFPLDDIYRDLDTLQRFLKIINSDENLLQDVHQSKAELIANDGLIKKPREASDKEPADDYIFSPGQIVCLKSNPDIKGAVVEVLPGKPEYRFRLFIDGTVQTYYQSQLDTENKHERQPKSLSCDLFHANLTALQIQYPNLSTLYSLNAARIDYIPYQFRPVMRFIRSDRPRLLIADGVGVGKTIEAGLILRELQARRDVKSILIICPRPLITERKWELEMRRFEERFTQLDGKTLRYCINETDLDGVWPEQHQKTIMPYSLFDESLLHGTKKHNKGKRKMGLLDLDPPPRFDLVIVDEAHHIRNQNTYAHEGVRFFCNHAEAAIFLSATPMQLGSHDLFVLLNVLRPDLIVDPESFQHMAEPNPHINKAVDFTRTQDPQWASQAKEALDKAGATPWGQAILKHNPEFIRIVIKLCQSNITSEEKIQLSKDIEGLHTFSGIINRTRRRDIGDFAIRKPETVTVEFTPEQKQLHDDILSIQAEIFSKIHDNANIKFMMTTIRRQTASCLFGLAPFLEEILNRHVDEVIFMESIDNPAQLLNDNYVTPIQDQIKEIIQKAKSLDPLDPKLEALRRIIRDKQTLDNNKIMLFSSFRHTLNYLYKHLLSEGYRVGMIHGNTPDEERIEFRNRFALSRQEHDCLDVLLFSEIGCEGLDYQFCDCIVNYDLPWNPMRVEQRIGRIDRKGQQSETVAIYNLITPGTVDADIYERCLVRIGVFNESLGGGEEILGEITCEIRNIAENFSLTEEERQAKLQQMADNKIRLIQEQEELEQKQMEFFGIRLPEDQMQKEIENASSFWLAPDSLRRLVINYLRQRGGKEQDYILGEKPLKTLRLSQEVRSILYKDYQNIPRQSTTIYREWENWLKGGNPHMPVTFDTECAARHPEAAFIMPLHPLVKQAAKWINPRHPVRTELKVTTDKVPPGVYQFAIYQWRFHGIKEDLVLKPIASSQLVTDSLDHLLQMAKDSEGNNQNAIENRIWDELDNQHYTLWSEARERHRRETRELAEYRRESLTRSHQASMSLFEERLNQASDEKIIRMRKSEILTAEAKYARTLQELDIAAERADVIAEAVAYGVITILGDKADAK